MTEQTIPKAIIIAGGMIAMSIGASHFGAAGFLFVILGLGGGGYLAWKEFWGNEYQSSEPNHNDIVADRFR
jgi:disulfide bond formation protein DsbB